MYVNHFFIFAVLCFISTTLAAPRPHTGMINDERFRDVGAIYSEPGYAGAGNFLLAVKGGSECQGLNQNIASIQICIPASCTFFTAEGCKEGNDGESFTVNGPGDVHTVPQFKGTHVSYVCSTDGTNAAEAKATLATTPHDSSKDKRPDMVLETEKHDESRELKGESAPGFV